MESKNDRGITLYIFFLIFFIIELVLAEEKIGDKECGFRQGRNITEQIFILRKLWLNAINLTTI